MGAMNSVGGMIRLGRRVRGETTWKQSTEWDTIAPLFSFAIGDIFLLCSWVTFHLTLAELWALTGFVPSG